MHPSITRNLMTELDEYIGETWHRGRCPLSIFPDLHGQDDDAPMVHIGKDTSKCPECGVLWCLNCGNSYLDPEYQLDEPLTTMTKDFGRCGCPERIATYIGAMSAGGRNSLRALAEFVS